MIGDRTTMSIRNEILRLHAKGLGKKKIALALSMSPTTVRGILKEHAEQITGVRAGRTDPPQALPPWSDQVAWDQVIKDLKKPYATIKQLAAEHSPEGVSYLRFWRALQRNVPADLANQARIRYHYKPGERFEIDYCDGFLITDRKTGKTRKTNLFVCVSACSDYVYGEFTFTQKSSEFLASQDRCFSFFGGVPEAVIIDNLKSGVTEAHRYDPEHNRAYFDYAKHMNFVVLPARPQTPRDKPSVETNIGVIQRQFFAENRNRVFYSLSELNHLFKAYSHRLNREEMKDYGVTRLERFENEKHALKPLPQNAFEVVEYKKAKVHTDCHVQVLNNFYSVPYRLIGQSMRVKIGTRIIEIFNADHDSVAVHARLNGRGEFSTNESHYPEGKIIANRLDILSLKRDASLTGINLSAVVDELLASPNPLRYLRRIQGLVRLRKNYSSAAIEYACAQALTFKRFQYQFIESLAKRHKLQGGCVISSSRVPVRNLSEVHLQPVKTCEEIEAENNE
jgi:transposase